MNNITGHVLLHRGLYDLPVFRSPLETSVFLYLYADAVWQDQDRRLADRTTVALRRGQTVSSERELSEAFGLHRNTLRRLLDRLVRAGLLSRRPAPGRTSNGTVWTIEKYEEYQSFGWYPCEDEDHHLGSDVPVGGADGGPVLSIEKTIKTEKTEIVPVSSGSVVPFPAAASAGAVAPEAAAVDPCPFDDAPTPGDGAVDLFGEPVAAVEAEEPPAKPKKPRRLTRKQLDVETPKFLEFWDLRPAKDPNHPHDRQEARIKFNALVAVGEDVEAILDGWWRYAQYVTAKGDLGTQFVKSAHNFLDPTKRLWELPWELPVHAAAPQGGSIRRVAI